MRSTENRSVRSAITTITKMAPAILTALVATGLGFLALYTSPVPMIQDFGKMLTIGMTVSFIIGLLFTVPLLFTRDRFFTSDRTSSKQPPAQPSAFSRLLNGFTRRMISVKWLIILVAFATAGVGIWADLQVGAETDIETFMPQDVTELQEIHHLRDVLGTTDQISLLYQSDNVLSDTVLQWVDQTSQSLSDEFPDVVVQTKSLTSMIRQLNDGQLLTEIEAAEFLQDIPAGQLKMLINEQQTQGVITVGIKHLDADALQTFISDINSYVATKRLPGLDVTVTGKAVLDVEMMSALTTGRYKMTLLGMLAVFLGLLVIYRNPVKAFIPLLPIILIVGWSGAAMYLLGFKYTPLTATLGALIIGIGTEFTILIMERFFEEQSSARTSADAIATAVEKVGIAIFASALTTIGGFSALLISDFRILSNFGMMTLINIFLALLSTMVVMPAILVTLGQLASHKRPAPLQMEME